MHVEDTIDLKSNFFLLQGKNIDVKVRGNVVRKMKRRQTEDIQYFLHCAEIDNTNIIFNLDLYLCQLGQA